MTFIAAHPELTRALGLVTAVLVVVGALLLLAAATRREPTTGRHGRRRGVRVGTPAEIRRHRRRGRERAWSGTRSARNRPPSNTHVLDEAASRRCRTANRYEDTGEITQADLEALLGPRPALIGASA